MFWAEIWKLPDFFFENFHFLVVKFSIYLNRYVFIMIIWTATWENVHFRKCTQWIIRSACASAQSVQSRRGLYLETLHPGLSIMRPVKILIILCEIADWSKSSPDTHVRAITTTSLYNFDPLKPHFYKVKLGFTGVYIIFLISAQKHRLWVLVRTASPRRF